MSHIGNKIIKIPFGVSIDILKNNILVKGKFGKLEKQFLPYVFFEKKNDELTILRVNDSKEAKSYHGLCRTLINNMVLGVSQLFTKTLVAEGIGYKFSLNNKFLTLNMGYTHPVKFELDHNINCFLDSPTRITIQGIDKELVGLICSKIRKVQPTETYKEKII